MQYSPLSQRARRVYTMATLHLWLKPQVWGYSHEPPPRFSRQVYHNVSGHVRASGASAFTGGKASADQHFGISRISSQPCWWPCCILAAPHRVGVKQAGTSACTHALTLQNHRLLYRDVEMLLTQFYYDIDRYSATLLSLLVSPQCL